MKAERKISSRAAARVAALACIGIAVPAGGAAAAKDCGAAGAQADMNICERRNLEKADADLNAAFKNLMAKIGADGQAKLRETQKAWLKYRDLQCDFEAMAMRGGTIHNMIVGQCLTRLTIEQTKRLRAQLDCEEGDLSCGGQ